jgi:hypothetical protein
LGVVLCLPGVDSVCLDQLSTAAFLKVAGDELVMSCLPHVRCFRRRSMACHLHSLAVEITAARSTSGGIFFGEVRFRPWASSCLRNGVDEAGASWGG